MLGDEIVGLVLGREPSTPTPGGSADGAAYLQLITDQLAQERARKASIESRGVGVITTSGALVTLLFGLAALATQSQNYAPPDLARLLLVLALLLFAAAAGMGLYANWIFDYYEVEPGVLTTEFNDTSGNAADAANRAAGQRIKIIASARPHNQTKARRLRLAMTLEVVALVPLVAAVWDVLATKS